MCEIYASSHNADISGGSPGVSGGSVGFGISPGVIVVRVGPQLLTGLSFMRPLTWGSLALCRFSCVKAPRILLPRGSSGVSGIRIKDRRVPVAGDSITTGFSLSLNSVGAFSLNPGGGLLGRLPSIPALPSIAWILSEGTVCPLARPQTPIRPGHETSRDETGPSLETSRGQGQWSRDVSRLYGCGLVGLETFG